MIEEDKFSGPEHDPEGRGRVIGTSNEEIARITGLCKTSATGGAKMVARARAALEAEGKIKALTHNRKADGKVCAIPSEQRKAAALPALEKATPAEEKADDDFLAALREAQKPGGEESPGPAAGCGGIAARSEKTTTDLLAAARGFLEDMCRAESVEIRMDIRDRVWEIVKMLPAVAIHETSAGAAAAREMTC